MEPDFQEPYLSVYESFLETEHNGKHNVLEHSRIFAKRH